MNNPNIAFKDRSKPERSTVIKFNGETVVLFTCECGWWTKIVLTTLDITTFKCYICGAKGLGWGVVDS